MSLNLARRLAAVDQKQPWAFGLEAAGRAKARSRTMGSLPLLQPPACRVLLRRLAAQLSIAL